MTSRSTTKRGLFITFEGPEGSGKSTQLRLLGKKLRGQNFAVLETAEPGGTPIGLQIRRVLLDTKNQELCPTTELLLMFAARAQNVEQAISRRWRPGRLSCATVSPTRRWFIRGRREDSVRKWFMNWIASPAEGWCRTSRWRSTSTWKPVWRARITAMNGHKMWKRGSMNSRWSFTARFARRTFSSLKTSLSG